MLFRSNPLILKAELRLQIVKKRVKRRLKTVKKVFVRGRQRDFPRLTQNTSFIERLNLTLRQAICFLQRKTLGYAKSTTRCEHILWINLVAYNYCWLHKSLRIDQTDKPMPSFKKRYLQQTPAMAMGITNQPLNWKFLITAPIPN